MMKHGRFLFPYEDSIRYLREEIQSLKISSVVYREINTQFFKSYRVYAYIFNPSFLLQKKLTAI